MARELDESGGFPWETFAAMAGLGLRGVPVRRELGGLGLDYLSYILVVEELAKVDAGSDWSAARFLSQAARNDVGWWSWLEAWSLVLWVA